VNGGKVHTLYTGSGDLKSYRILGGDAIGPGSLKEMMNELLGAARAQRDMSWVNYLGPSSSVLGRRSIPLSQLSSRLLILRALDSQSEI
jgi:hypothetical protein